MSEWEVRNAENCKTVQRFQYSEGTPWIYVDLFISSFLPIATILVCDVIIAISIYQRAMKKKFLYKVREMGKHSDSVKYIIALGGLFLVTNAPQVAYFILKEYFDVITDHDKITEILPCIQALNYAVKCLIFYSLCFGFQKQIKTKLLLQFSFLSKYRQKIPGKVFPQNLTNGI